MVVFIGLQAQGLPLIEFLDLICIQIVALLGRTDNRPTARLLPTHITGTEKTHTCLGWVSNPWSQCPSGRISTRFLPMRSLWSAKIMALKQTFTAATLFWACACYELDKLQRKLGSFFFGGINQIMRHNLSSLISLDVWHLLTKIFLAAQIRGDSSKERIWKLCEPVPKSTPLCH